MTDQGGSGAGATGVDWEDKARQWHALWEKSQDEIAQLRAENTRLTRELEATRGVVEAARALEDHYDGGYYTDYRVTLRSSLTVLDAAQDTK